MMYILSFTFQMWFTVGRHQVYVIRYNCKQLSVKSVVVILLQHIL